MRVLCVGGPKHGEWIDTNLHHFEVRYPKPKPPPEVRFIPNQRFMTEPEEVLVCGYSCERWIRKDNGQIVVVAFSAYIWPTNKRDWLIDALMGAMKYSNETLATKEGDDEVLAAEKRERARCVRAIEERGVYGSQDARAGVQRAITIIREME
jgi:hypothetical protein